MLANLAAQQPTLLKFVTGFSVLIGFLMAFRALYQLKEYGEMRTMMASNTDLRKPVMTFFIALVLIYWKEVLDAMMYATFRTSSPLEYEATGWIYDDVMSMAGMLIQLIGVIAFIRGWVLLTHIGQQGSQPGMLGKALTHIFGGLFAVNIFGTFKILKGTLGIS
jgi:intracellular multiplication protein IcmC